MKPLLLMICISSIAFTNVQAQKYFTREGKISFTSEAPLEKIEAYNNSAMSVLDFESGNIEFAVLIKAFQFRKALMQEHFNENYMESNKFPKAVFKGKIDYYDQSSLMAEGEHLVKVSGKITIHGVTKDLIAEGKITVNDGQVTAYSTFDLAVADFDIKIPGIMSEKIAETVTVTVDLDYQAFKSN